MKTISIKAILTAALLICAGKNGICAIESTSEESHSETIKSGMRLPDDLKWKITKEEVKVEFCLDEKKRIVIKAIHSDNEEIKKFIAQKFCTLSFNDLKHGENYFVNIVYRVY